MPTKTRLDWNYVVQNEWKLEAVNLRASQLALSSVVTVKGQKIESLSQEMYSLRGSKSERLWAGEHFIDSQEPASGEGDFSFLF